MSVSHRRRRKTIKKLKRKFKGHWRQKFDALRDEIEHNTLGPVIGTLADIISPTGGGSPESAPAADSGSR